MFGLLRWREGDEMTKIIIGDALSVGEALCLFAAAAARGEGEKSGLLAGRVLLC